VCDKAQTISHRDPDFFFFCVSSLGVRQHLVREWCLCQDVTALALPSSERKVDVPSPRCG